MVPSFRVAELAEAVGDDRLGHRGEEAPGRCAFRSELQIGDPDFAEAIKIDLPHTDAKGFDEDGEGSVENAGPVEVGDRGDRGDQDEDAGNDDGGQARESHEPPQDAPRRTTDPFRVFDWCFVSHGLRL